MYNQKSFLGIITARGGSKRLPDKNILDLSGKPLIAWTVQAGLKSRYIDELTVSSDDDRIIAVSKEFGASVPFKRPDYLATDTATSADVVLHAIDYYEKIEKRKFDFIVLLQPTSPLRNESDIDRAIELLFDKKGDAVISVCETEHSPLLCNTIPENGSMVDFIDKGTKKLRAQDLPKYYRLNGAIYICSVDRFLKEKTFFLSSGVYAYPMDTIKSIDIDTMLDFQFAEFILGRK